MYRRIALCAIVFSILAAIAPGSSRASTSGTHGAVKPHVVENGSDLVLYHFLNNSPRPIAFDPAGNSYSSTRNGLLKITPDV